MRAAKPGKRKDGPFFAILPTPGYSLATGFTADIDGDVSFYTDKKFKGTLSFFDFDGQYSRYNQVFAQSNSILFFHHDKLQLTGDWRYYNFPTSTYGLGSYTSFADENRISYSYIRFYETAVYRIGVNTLAGIGYNFDYHWHIKENPVSPGVKTDLAKYGYSGSSVSSGTTVNLIYDSRNNIHSPTSGEYLSFQFCTHHGCRVS